MRRTVITMEDVDRRNGIVRPEYVFHPGELEQIEQAKREATQPWGRFESAVERELDRRLRELLRASGRILTGSFVNRPKEASAARQSL